MDLERLREIDSRYQNERANARLDAKQAERMVAYYDDRILDVQNQIDEAEAEAAREFPSGW